ncbi:hypothetical protein N7535_009076 [Penicillium sp. DV-2018c]|nr:hypothetical protein N7535_009076 [Penicillium sp. DV-2018c]
MAQNTIHYYAKFKTLEAARNEMRDRGIGDFDPPIENHTRDITPANKRRHWAVAGPGVFGIFTDWESAQEVINGRVVCHEAFDSREEALDFIASFKDAFADVYRLVIRQALRSENGWGPRDMEFDVESFLTGPEDMENMMGNV